MKDAAGGLRSFFYIGGPGHDEAESKRWANKFWRAHPKVERVLRESDSLDTARKQLYDWMVERERAIRARKLKVHPLEWSVIRDSSRVLRNIFSRRCEKMAGFSSLECLWNIANNRWSDVPKKMKPGFFEEFHRLFLAVQGKSGLYVEAPPRFAGLSGREAGAARSDELDALEEHSEAFITSYSTGLDRDAVERRAKNRQRIMKELRVSKKQWDDYRWQLKNVIRDEEELGRFVQLTDDEWDAIRLAKKHRIPFGVTPYYCSLMDLETDRGNDHAIRAQVIPSKYYVREMARHRRRGIHSTDFMMESETSPIDLVTRRYPRVAIFKPYNTCAQICVYCQRNWEIDDVLCPGALASKGAIEGALRWFEKHPMVREVLITGGDAFIMNDDTIEGLLKRFSRMKHVERVRFGTRTPVVLPQRITPKLVSILKRYLDPPNLDISIVTHYEHAYEVTPESAAAIRRLRDAGMSVYNQMVFTVENSRRFEAVATRLVLKRIGVDPYYTFMMKGKSECDEMRVPIARALQEQKEEGRLMPGTVRTDETVYNVPRLGKNNIRAWQHHDLIMILPDGSRVLEFHPWEKKISLVDVYVDRDVPIYDYLMELAYRGEDVKEYESIWYYY
jgi:lysine 2,3-aminomutase